jgi:hypothetical protein
MAMNENKERITVCVQSNLELSIKVGLILFEGSGIDWPQYFGPT